MVAWLLARGGFEELQDTVSQWVQWSVHPSKEELSFLRANTAVGMEPVILLGAAATPCAYTGNASLPIIPIYSQPIH